MIVQNLDGRKSGDPPSLRFLHLSCSASPVSVWQAFLFPLFHKTSAYSVLNISVESQM